MAVMTAGCLLGAAELAYSQTQYALQAAAWIIAAGALLTCATRTFAIARQLQESAR